MAGQKLRFTPNRVIDSNGISDGSIAYFYAAGTTTLQTVYADADLTVPLANPYTIDAGAAFPTVFIDPTLSYRLLLRDSAGNVIEDVDPYDDGLSQFLGAVRSYTRADAIISTIPETVLRLATIGYTTAYDGGHAWYKRVATQPSHAGKFQDAGGQWWEIDETELFVEQFGGGPTVTDNSPAIAALIGAVPDMVKGTPDTGSNPYTFWGGANCNFRYGKRYQFATRIIVPASKAIIFKSIHTPGATNLRFTGTSWDGILFEDKGVAGRFGFDGVSVEGCDVVAVGGSSSGMLLRNGYHSHAKRLGLAIIDNLYYHNNDTRVAKAITAMTAENPVQITCAGHGFTTGDYIAQVDCEGEERVNGKYWITVVDTNTYRLYTNSARTTGLNGTGFVAANFTGGLATKGYPTNGTSGTSLTWVDVNNWQCEASVGHMIYVASSSYLLLHVDKLRCRLAGKAPLVLDCQGWRINDLEAFGVEEDNADLQPYVWLPCRLNDNAQGLLNNFRCGTEDVPSTAGTFTGGDYTQKRWTAPRRKVVIGPLDGSPARMVCANVSFMNGKWYGTNQENEVGIEFNAGAQAVTIGGPAWEIKSFAETGALIKNTHSDAGRAQSTAAPNILEDGLNIPTSFAGKIFHTGSVAWINKLETTVTSARKDLTIATRPGVGDGTVVKGATDNVKLFTLTITPGTGASGAEIATITLPVAYPRSVKPIITPVNLAACALSGNWGYQSTTTSSFVLRAPSALTSGTAYTVDVELRGCF